VRGRAGDGREGCMRVFEQQERHRLSVAAPCPPAPRTRLPAALLPARRRCRFHDIGFSGNSGDHGRMEHRSRKPSATFRRPARAGASRAFRHGRFPDLRGEPRARDARAMPRSARRLGVVGEVPCRSERQDHELPDVFRNRRTFVHVLDRRTRENNPSERFRILLFHERFRLRDDHVAVPITLDSVYS
jgi:hypothetical protein